MKFRIQRDSHPSNDYMKGYKRGFNGGALSMFTLNAAEMLGMDARLGSLDVGKDADLLILEGHPFDYRVLPSLVYIDGKLVTEEK